MGGCPISLQGGDFFGRQQSHARRVRRGHTAERLLRAAGFPYVPVQKNDPERYSQQDALKAGTLFPGLNLPFHAQMKTKFPAVNTALSELMALDFAIDELGLYLTTHPEDTEVLNLYWSYIKLGREGREAYESSTARFCRRT